jgi:CheY-like chemotaxis protein
MNMEDVKSLDVLLVEDNPHDAELAIRALRSQHLANRIVTVEDGAEALDFLFCRGSHAGRDINERPRVVLLDLKLPKLSGLEVLKEVRRDERTRTIPIVVLTSSAEDRDIASAYALGANSYVVKPVDFDHFSEAVRGLGRYWLLLNQPAK